MRGWAARACAVVLTGCAALACSHSERWCDACPPRNEPLVAPAVEATNQLIVYLDASKSMKGFVGERLRTEAASAKTVFSRSLLELRSIVNSLQPQPQVLFRVTDARVHPPEHDFRLAQYAVNREWFDGTETDLAGVFRAFEEPVEPGTSQPALFHVLVTDGVQSTRHRVNGEDCLQGSDSRCVKERMNELISRGWGGAVLGVRADFDGPVYSEIQPDRPPVEYHSETGKPETYRPFYLFVFSPNRAALDQLVRALKAALRPLLCADEQLREYALTSAFVEGQVSGELVATDADSFKVFRERDAPAGALCFNVDVSEAPRRRPAQGEAQSDADPMLRLTLRLDWSHDGSDSGTPQEMAGMLRWELAPVAPTPEKGVRYPELKIAGSTANADGSVTLLLSAHWEDGKGKRRPRVYRLVGRLDLEKPAPPWVALWSAATDVTREEAARTLNLKDSLANLWNNESLRRQEAAVVCLRVGNF